jgi:hypothetical protein
MTDHLGHPDAEHMPVMSKEALDLLQCKPGGIYVDATIGLGGHAEAILERIQPGGQLIGIDRDKESLEKAQVRLQTFVQSLRLLHDNYKNLPLILNNLAGPPVDGILVDLGVSSYQLLSPERGFSFQSDVMLDMRMDRTQQWTAADLVNNLAETSWPISSTAMAKNGSPAGLRRRSFRNGIKPQLPAAHSWPRLSAAFLEFAVIREFILRPELSKHCESR